MKNCLIGAKRLLTPNGWEENKVLTIEDGRITRIATGTTADFTAEILSPAPIDPHLHGGDVQVRESGESGTKIELTLPASAEERGMP